MKKYLYVVIFLIAIIYVVSVFSAVTLKEKTYTSLKEIQFVWISNAGGVAETTTTETYTGEVIGMYTVPGTGLQEPTDSYDITIKTTDTNVDVLNSNGLNRSSEASEYISYATMIPVSANKLVFSVSNAGAVTNGTAYLFIR